MKERHQNESIEITGPEPGSEFWPKLSVSSPMPLSASVFGPIFGVRREIICSAFEMTAFTRAFSDFSCADILFAQSIASSKL